MKIFTEILKATPINFIVSYFSFIVQKNYEVLLCADRKYEKLSSI